MRKNLLFICLLFCCVGGVILYKFDLLVVGSSRPESSDDYAIESTNLLESETMEMSLVSDSDQYLKSFTIPPTTKMPTLTFELLGKREVDSDYGDFYYPIKLVIKAEGSIMQEISFNQDDFAPCTLDDFGFEYGDFKFDGYGGFRILSTSMGKNPSYYFGLWDMDNICFIRYPDLELVGYMTFNYKNQTINVSGTASADEHEYTTYKYINDELTLIERIVDPDLDGYRKKYKLIDGKLELTETSESQLK